MLEWHRETHMVLNSMKNWIVPQDKIFFNLLSAGAKNMLEGAVALNSMLKDYRDIERKRNHIKSIESKGDNIVHELYTRLNTTFIVPIDHTDISSLASSLDDILDMCEGVATRLFLYKVKKPTPELVAISETLVLQAQEIEAAVLAFNSRKNYPAILERCVTVNTLENKADDEYRKALAKLFTKKDAIEIIKMKELYDTIERATDFAEDAANVVKDIILKHS